MCSISVKAVTDLIELWKRNKKRRDAEQYSKSAYFLLFNVRTLLSSVIYFIDVFIDFASSKTTLFLNDSTKELFLSCRVDFNSFF